MIKTIAKRLLPLSLALVVMISLFPPIAASAADSEYTLSGYWLFNENIGAPSNEYNISENILFTSNGQAFSSISYVRDEMTGTPSLKFCAIKYNSVKVKEWSWTDEAYRYVDFGSTPQTVSFGFYFWFTSHATQQTRPETVFIVDVDGSSFQYPSTADSITLDLIITANDYKLSVDGSEEDYLISDTVLNNDRQQFAGLSVEGVVDQVDYGIGRHEIILTPFNSTLLLGTVWKYPLYIDPNGGTWNGSSSVSVFWELANTDTEDIYDPVRPGYTFNGWTFTGDGEFNDVGDPPYIYEHGSAPGYLTANWVADSPDPGTGNTYTTTITIAGKTLTFTGSGSSPDITVSDTGYSVMFTDGVSTKSVSYNILGVTAASFGGLSFTENGSPFLSPGGSYVIGGLYGADFTIELYPISQPASEFVIPAGQYEANKYVMTGEYLDLPSWPSDLDSVPFVFISSGASYHSMSTGLYLPTSQAQLQYGSTAAYRYAQANNSAGFVQDAFALVYLSSDQAVPEAFYNWFTSAFTRISDDPAEPVYTTTINIYDVTGAKLLASWSLSAPGAAPSYTFSVLENGILISSDTTWTWTEAAEPFYGFSLSAGSSAAAFAPGEVSTFTGSSADFTLDLFVASELNDKEYQAGVIGWFERIFDKLSEFVDSNLIFPELGDFLSVVDFGSVGSFFVDMYQNVTSVFGLRTLIEDPAGPFAWLMAS